LAAPRKRSRRFKVADETRSWSYLVSITAGGGTITNGIGDLRGE
jgi:hypothetical protein